MNCVLPENHTPMYIVHVMIYIAFSIIQANDQKKGKRRKNVNLRIVSLSLGTYSTGHY